ncbi:hypothetical protein DPX16_1985 [Anabarilius grahami]|uniref:LINE-1 type transposase domain-containing protein 1 n=1 Tax=Anabarilius grahami TaxID=495550 RepID=A0A3N0Z5R7_ANAGA|nr:hypothetical protein DPX16_1985 [Anabarilius grahami]
MPRSTKKMEKKESSSATLDISPEQGDGEENDEVELSPAMAKAFQHMTETISKTIDVKLDPLVEIIHTHSQELENCKSRLDEAERRIVSAEELADSMKARVSTLENRVASLTEHVDDLENRGWRENIRIVGLPEGAEGSNAVAFIQKWIQEFLQLQTEGAYINIERACRTLAPRPGAKERPRPLVLRMHHFGDGQRILEATKLRVTIGNTTKILGSPTAVSEFIAEIGQDVRPEAADSPPVMDE